MLECVESMKKYGILVRWKGGFWTREGCPVKYMFGEIPFPEWHYNWSTVKALVDRKIFVFTEYNRDHNFQEYPVAAKMN